MELFIYITLSAILLETTALTVKTFGSKSIRAGQKARRKVFVDTSTLMDGRILSVAKAGFLGDEILIPRSVIRELQLLADGSDSDKRSRARFGLDVVNELERVEMAQVEIFPDSTERTKVINDLAQGLRSEYLPGDRLAVKVVNVGSNPHQGVAYLPDGTMVVIDDAERYAGKKFPVEIEFVRYLQTASGKMMFAKLAEPKPKQKKNPRRKPTGRQPKQH